MKILKLAVVAAITAALSACATPETRVRNALINAGLPKPISACMADQMVDELSLMQLNKLNGLSKLKDKNAGDISMNEFIKRTKSLRDPEIIGVVAASGVACTLK